MAGPRSPSGPRTPEATRQGTDSRGAGLVPGQESPEANPPGPARVWAHDSSSTSNPNVRAGVRRQAMRGRRRKCPFGAPDATGRRRLPGRRELPRAAGIRDRQLRSFLWRALTAGVVLSGFSGCSFT